MKKLAAFTFLILFVFVSAWADTEKRDVGNFERISLGTSCKVYITQGDTYSLELHGDKDDLKKIETNVSNGKLTIKNTSSNWGWSNIGDVEIYITLPKLSGLSVSGSGGIFGKSSFKSDEVDLAVSGSGKIELDLQSNSVDSSISGSGRILLTGKGNGVDISISGSGRMDAQDFLVKDVKVRISGSGGSKVNVSESLDVHVSGSGRVYYQGDADKIRSHVSGSGGVKKMD